MQYMYMEGWYTAKLCIMRVVEAMLYIRGVNKLRKGNFQASTAAYKVGRSLSRVYTTRGKSTYSARRLSVSTTTATILNYTTRRNGSFVNLTLNYSTSWSWMHNCVH